MASGTGQIRPPQPRRSVANDRFKNSFRFILAGCIMAAALIHGLILIYGPSLSVKDLRSQAQEIIALDIPLRAEIPPPPAAIAHPQVPVLTTRLDISEEITIQDITFTFIPVERLPPPPIRSVDLSEEPAFTPRTVEPRLARDQRAALQRYLSRNYPAALLAAGIGARTTLWIFINAEGEVDQTRIVQSSGYPAFDAVAQEAVRTVRFSPAWNRDVRVPVWVQLPITWKTG